MNSTTLNRMMDFVKDQNILINGVVVVRNGYVVLEEYPRSVYDGTWPHPLYSVTKSFTSALMGIAVKEGFMNSIEDKVLDFFPGRSFANMSSWKQAVTVRHLLTMTSGLPWDESSVPYTDSRNDVRCLTSALDPMQFLLDRSMVSEPGAQWDYNSGGSHLLMEIVNQTTGVNPMEYATEHLFDPLGITNLRWGTSGQGIPWGFYDLHLTPLDMAKFGYLYLNNGTWDGTEILPAEWVAESTESHIMLYGVTGYGYQWWVMDQTRGICDARGMYGQRIIVIPEYDMVVVFVASIPDGSSSAEDYLLQNYILPSVDNPPPIRDVGVIGFGEASGQAVAPMKPIAGQGTTVSFSVLVRNFGTVDENLAVTAHINETLLSTQTDISVSHLGFVLVNFTWNTSSFDKGSYLISVQVATVPNEAEADNNILACSVVLGTIGDINNDGTVNTSDIYDIALFFGTIIGQASYIPNCDVNDDGITNMLDLYAAAIRCGQTGKQGSQ
jgi:CubicO group peptidase (beta-lactamase class C family)